MQVIHSALSPLHGTNASRRMTLTCMRPPGEVRVSHNALFPLAGSWSMRPSLLSQRGPHPLPRRRSVSCTTSIAGCQWAPSRLADATRRDGKAKWLRIDVARTGDVPENMTFKKHDALRSTKSFPPFIRNTHIAHDVIYCVTSGRKRMTRFHLSSAETLVMHEVWQT